MPAVKIYEIGGIRGLYPQTTEIFIRVGTREKLFASECRRAIGDKRGGAWPEVKIGILNNNVFTEAS